MKAELLRKLGIVTEDSIEKYIHEQIRGIPPLPEGWVWEYSFEESFTPDIKEFRVTAKPVEQCKDDDNEKQ